MQYTPASVHLQIDFSFFRKSDTAFVNARLGVSFSDVMYETRLKSGGLARLLFLFEHKSYVPTQPVHLQLLDYFLQIWEDDLKNKRPLSFIVPIVVYHGERRWAPKAFPNFFEGLPGAFRRFIPSFESILTDLSRIPQKVILEKVKTEYLAKLFLTLKFARNKRLVREYWPRILNFDASHYRDDREAILVQILSIYLVKIADMPPAEFKDLNQRLPEPSRKLVEIAREIFGDEIPRLFTEEWREKGLKEGREIGREEGREEMANAVTIKFLQKFPDWSDAAIAELIGCSVADVQKVRKALATEK